MTKFIGKTMTMQFQGIDVPCIQSVEFSEDVEQVIYHCPESDTGKILTGVKNITMSANLLLDGGATGLATLGNVAVNQYGTILFRPQGAGAGNLLYTGLGTSTQRNTSFSINGVTAVSLEFRLDSLAVTV